MFIKSLQLAKYSGIRIALCCTFRLFLPFAITSCNNVLKPLSFPAPNEAPEALRIKFCVGLDVPVEQDSLALLICRWLQDNY